MDTPCINSDVPADITEMGDITRIVNARLDDYKKGLAANDFQKSACVFAEDGQLLPPNQNAFVGRRGLVAFNEELKKQGRPGIEYQRVDNVELISPTWALARVYFYLTVGGNRQGLSKAVTVWKKVGDQWFIYRSIFNDEPQ